MKIRTKLTMHNMADMHACSIDQLQGNWLYHGYKSLAP